MSTPGAPLGGPDPRRQPAPGYRTPGDYSFGTPDAAPAHVRAETAQLAHPSFAAPVRQSTAGTTVALIVGIVIAGLAVLVALAYVLLSLGGAAIIGGVLALIPLTFVLLGVRWVDRWDPEPRLALLFAFLWGAGVAVVLALLVGLGIDLALYASGADPMSDPVQFFGLAIQAPVVEEFGKGLGVLLIFLFGRKYFDGPVDGVVYAAVTAGGFAFTENILYFGRQIVDEGGLGFGVAFVFFLRAILSPFAHVMFTSMTGIALGLAAERTTRAGGILFFLVGLIPAMLLHGFWNGSSFFAADYGSFFLVYALVQVPLFVGLVLLVVWLRRKEVRVTMERLSEYAAAGWFNQGEVVSLATPRGRSQARAWAVRFGLAAVMKKYIQDATKLAFTRQRIISGRDRIGAQQDEAQLLGEVTQSRRAIQNAALAQQQYAQQQYAQQQLAQQQWAQQQQQQYPSQQQYPPQGQQYPPQGQQYPPQQYPPQGQQYPPQGQQYPPQQYPPQGQQYPPQGQQYPPQQYPPQGQQPPQQYPPQR